MNELQKLQARMTEILEEINAFEGVENHTDEQIETINALSDEFESAKNRVSTLERLESIKASASVSERKTKPEAPKAKVNVEVNGRYDKTMGFKNLGEFAKAVADKSRGKVDQRFNNATHFEQVAEDGGVLIPSDFLSEIREKVMGDQSLISRTSSFNVSGNHLSMPIDEVQPWSGGIQAYWMGEGQQYTESKHNLGQANFRLHKLGALVKATDELLEDATALESLIRRKAPQAIVQKLNSAIIDGDGSAKPEGILNSGFTYEVAAEGGQAADTIVYKNLVKMESRLIPGSGAVWLAHPQVREQLLQLKDDNGNHIYMAGAQFPNMAAQPFELLLGRPVIYLMGSMPALGDSGDLILADMSYYYSVMKTAGIKQDISTHLYFDRDITAFKFSMRVDGRCPFKSPITTENGAYDMSGFIKLAAR